MSIVKFIGILSNKILYIILLPIIAAAITFLLIKDMPKQYTAETTIYTGITSNSGLDVTVTKVDKLITQNEYSNIMSIFKSNSLYEEVSLRLMAQHLSLAKAVPDVISEESFLKIQSEFPSEIKKLAVIGNQQQTYLKLRNYLKQDEKNFIYRMLNFNHPFYSINAISQIKAEQVNSSDLFRISFESRDAGVCCNTVKIASDVFIKSYGQIKKNLKNSAVKYFQNKLEEVYQKLNNAENNLLNFNIDNSIINYYEQTKQVTTQHEEIELRLQNVKMNYEGSIAVMHKIEEEISKRMIINLKNVEILNIRSQLVDCNNKIARHELNSEELKDGVSSKLYERKLTLEKKLEQCIDSIFNIENSSQGIESQKIMGEWLEAVKNLETNKAMYKSMKERQIEFMMQFKRYAPLGANIKRIEREINVYENEYLNILNNLNIALQNEQNSNIISNMRIIDPAKFPISSLPSKKKLYLIIAALIALIMYISAIFIIELLDNRLKSPSMLKNITGLDIAGAFSIGNNRNFSSFDAICEKAVTFITERLNYMTDFQKKPIIVQILSNWDDNGNSFVTEKLTQHLKKIGFNSKVLNLMQIMNEHEKSENIETNSDILKKFYVAKSYNDLFDETFNSFDYIFCILPAISRGIDNSRLIALADFNLLIFSADLTWTSADQFNLDKIRNMLQSPLFAVLINALPENLEEIYGDIPKKRSKIRILTKKLLKRFVR